MTEDRSRASTGPQPDEGAVEPVEPPEPVSETAQTPRKSGQWIIFVPLFTVIYLPMITKGWHHPVLRVPITVLVGCFGVLFTTLAVVASRRNKKIRNAQRKEREREALVQSIRGLEDELGYEPLDLSDHPAFHVEKNEEKEEK